MTLQQGIKAIVDGKAIRRKAWMPGEKIYRNKNGDVVMTNSTPWMTVDDFDAMDWEVTP